MEEPDGFREFVEGRSRDLLRFAWMLSGDWHTAEDLVQTALVKTWPHWHRLVRRDRPELYVRKVMLTTYLSWRKRRSASEVPVAEIYESAAAHSGDSEMRHVLVDALRGLSPRQRAVVVLRYFDDLTEAETAAALGCSVGTVKTHASRALAHLRGVPGLATVLEMEAHG